jgi:DNA-directed RNA polymerase subunit RPC12/RpoP
MAAQTTTRCTTCGRTLRAAKSIAAGRGPRCQAKVRAAAKTAVVAEFKPATIAKALELIADNGIVPIAARRLVAFRVVSSNGTGTYLTAPAGCNCPAGLKARHACYHRVAATILAAA